VFLAYAIETSRSGVLRRLVATASGVLANFGGINLTFMFIATLGSTGVLTAWLSVAHLNPWNHGFNLYSFYGVAFVYLYFQIPLMVLVITRRSAGFVRHGGRRRRTWEHRAFVTGARWAFLSFSPRCSGECCFCSAALSLPTPRLTH